MFLSIALLNSVLLKSWEKETRRTREMRLSRATLAAFTHELLNMFLISCQRYLHPGKLTWTLKFGGLEEDFRSTMWMFGVHISFSGVYLKKCYSPCLCQIGFLCLTTLASAKASLAWSILAIHITSGWHCDWVNTESMSGTLTCWEKRHLESGCPKWLVAWAPRYFFVRYLGFLLSVRDPENGWEMMRSTLTFLMKPSH